MKFEFEAELIARFVSDMAPLFAKAKTVEDSVAILLKDTMKLKGKDAENRMKAICWLAYKQIDYLMNCFIKQFDPGDFLKDIGKNDGFDSGGVKIIVAKIKKEVKDEQ